MTKPAGDAITLRSLTPAVFLPAFVYEIGNGAVLPVIALTALHLGASVSTAGFVLTLLGIGQVLGDIPSSSLANRLGDRRAMLVAALVAVAGQLACAFAPSLAVLGVALLLVGMCNATFYLARQTYVVEVVPTGIRARAMSTMGGSHRMGLFLGPFAGAAAISIGGLRAAYLVAVVTAVCVAVLLVTIPDVQRMEDQPQPVRGTTTAVQMLKSYRRLYATLGVAVLAVGAVRAARQTVLPLWAEHIGLDAATTSLVFGIASAVDMALFYPSGLIMDKYGRRAVTIPSMVIVGFATMALPLAHSVLTLTAVAMTISLGNGIGSGIMMTLGADVAPAENRISFLSIWRTMGDSGNALGPVVVSVLASAATLAVGIVGVGSVGLLAAAGLARWAPRWSPYWWPPGRRRDEFRSDGRREATTSELHSPR